MIPARVKIESLPDDDERDWSSMVMVRHHIIVLEIVIGWPMNRLTLKYRGENYELIEAGRLAMEDFLNDKPYDFVIEQYSNTITFNPRILKWIEVDFQLDWMNKYQRELFEEILKVKRERKDFTGSLMLNESQKLLS